MIRMVLRFIVLALGSFISLLLIFIIVSIAPVDRAPAQESPAIREMMARLDTLKVPVPKPARSFSVGFAKRNITPSEPIATAGYGKRKGQPYSNVHDSIYVRVMVIDNGTEKVAVVSADLLIMPPTVTRLLEKRLPEIGFSLDNTYLGATHSHNSIGHWGEGATRFIYGKYEDSVVQFIADNIVSGIEAASGNVLPAIIKTGGVSIPRAVENRLIDDGAEDPLLRAVEVHRSDSSKGVLLSYQAHATCLSQRTLELSRDYPGEVVDGLEEKDYDFAMFLAGAVGSHRESAPGSDWECMEWMSNVITGDFLLARDSLKLIADSSLVMKRIPLPLTDPQVKVSEDWRLRAWLFRAAFGQYPAYLTVLRIGDLVMLGTPCDFSGEFNAGLDSVAQSLEMHAMVTSFNGGYIGYVTPGEYYDIDHYETRLMNWYAPGTGDYMRDCLEDLMIAVSETR